MRHMTDPQLEAHLRTALDAGDTPTIDACAIEMDNRDAQRPQPSTSLLGAALWYAASGLHIFPIRPGQKIPHPGTHGCKDATTDETTIRTWWDQWPDSNIGIATGHTVDVIDIDGTPGQIERAQAWDTIFGQVDNDKLAVVLTPRPGGMHIYVPATGDGNSAGILPAIDYRGVGGYVVAPPSTITAGPNPGTYTFLSAPDFTNTAT